MSLAEAALAGNRLALARLLTQVENDTVEARSALSELFPHTGRAHLIGVTGAPGTGKSSLVNSLARHYRLQAEPRRVAIVAVDPSSPFTGGAILGDRVRMRDLSGDPGVFIRSMASRGSLGGLAHTTARVVQALDAAGFDVIMIETVGAGQAEVNIARLAHTTLVVEAPGLGDDIQAIKAGILEIADILVVNKADLPGADATERALRNMLEMAHPVRRTFQQEGGLSHHSHSLAINAPAAKPAFSEDPGWIPLVLRTISTEAAGMPELAGAIAQHYYYLQATGDWQRREQARLQAELDMLLRDTLFTRWQQSIPPDLLDSTLQAIFDHNLSPQQAVASLLSGDLT